MSLDVERIASAVQACPAVAGLHGGHQQENVTYLPEGRLVGVRVSEGQLVIGVVGRYPVGVAEIAAQVRAAVAPLAPGVHVTITVEDLYVAGDPTDRSG